MTETSVYILYFLFTLGGAGVYLSLPQGERSEARVGAILGLSAVIGWLTLVSLRLGLFGAGRWCFYLFAAAAVLAAGRVITHPKPVYSAIYFVLVVVAVAGLLILQHAEFLAVSVIIVYAGAILVTYLFVIMLAQQPGSQIYDRRAREPFAAVVVGFVLMAAVAGRAGELPDKPAQALRVDSRLPTDPESSAPTILGNTADMGGLVMTKYVVVVEIAAVLLLVSLIGAIAMSRKQAPTEALRAPLRPLGQIGKEVEPF